MNRIVSHLNIILVCCNILGLGSYLFNKIIITHQYIYLVVMFVASLPNLQQYARFKQLHFCLIGTMAVTATFLKDQKIDMLLCSVALAYTTNLGYLIINKNKDEMKIKFYESIVNLSFSFAVFISIFNAYMEVSKLTAKIFILVTVLPNFYLSYNDQIIKDNSLDSNRENHLVGQRGEEPKDLICNKLIYCLNPLLGQTLAYALGYGIGIYINIFQIVSLAKYIKYLIVALLILIQTLTYKQLIKMICLFLRSILVFHYQHDRHKYQSYFILIYLILGNFTHQDVVNLYLMVGYVVIAVMIWREEYQVDFALANLPSSSIPHNQNSHLTERRDYDHQRYNEHQIQMPLIPQKDSSLSASRRNDSF